jgi:hypothetical protein
MDESSHRCTKDRHYSKSITESYRTVSSTIELKRNALFTSIWKCIILSFGEKWKKIYLDMLLGIVRGPVVVRWNAGTY